MIDGEMYEGTINIALDTEGDTFYDITNIERTAQQHSSDNKIPPASTVDGSLNESSITQGSEKVNRENEKKFSFTTDEYSDVRKYLRKTKIRLETGKNDIANGDYRGFKEAYKGRLKLVENNAAAVIGVDTAYQELNAMDGSLFPDDIINAQDQLNRIGEVLDYISTKNENLITEQNIGDKYAEWVEKTYGMSVEEYDEYVEENGTSPEEVVQEQDIDDEPMDWDEFFADEERLKNKVVQVFDISAKMERDADGTPEWAKTTPKVWDEWQAMIDKYGAFEQGEEPRTREFQVPKQRTDKLKVPKFNRTAAESGVVAEEATEAFKENVLKQANLYTTQSNAETLETAKRKAAAIQDKVAAIENFETREATLDNIAIGEVLIKYFAEQGDYDSVVKLIPKVAILGKEAGQAVQIMRLMKRVGAVGELQFFESEVNRLNDRYAKDLTKAGKKKTNKNGVNEQEAAQKKLDAVSREREQLQKKIDEVKAELADKKLFEMSNEELNAEIDALIKSIAEEEKARAKDNADANKNADGTLYSLALTEMTIEEKKARLEKLQNEVENRKRGVSMRVSGTNIDLKAELKELNSQLNKVDKKLEMANAKVVDAEKEAQLTLLEGEGFTPITIDPELKKELLVSKEGREREAVKAKIFKSLGEQVPTNWFEKWNAWRYMAMLTNPKTHLRNIVGNAGFTPVIGLKNIVKQQLERLPGVQKTVGKETFRLTKNSPYYKFVNEDFAKISNEIMSGGKYTNSNEIDDNKTIFKTKWLEAIRKTNGNFLEKEDFFALKGQYTRALAGYLSANNANVKELSERSGGVRAQQLLEKARIYAVRESQKATYRDASKAADLLNNLAKTNRTADILVNGLVPFKKTPVNILKRGVTYSPLGLINAAGKFAKVVKMAHEGKITGTNEQQEAFKLTVSDAIDATAQGLTGTVPMALGFVYCKG
jgi:hypothetical protein